MFKKKRAFEHPSCDDTGHSLGVTWTVVENRPGTRSPRQPATESSNDTSDNVEKKTHFCTVSMQGWKNLGFLQKVFRLLGF